MSCSMEKYSPLKDGKEIIFIQVDKTIYDLGFKKITMMRVLYTFEDDMYIEEVGLDDYRDYILKYELGL